MEKNIELLREMWGNEATDKILLAIINEGKQDMKFAEFFTHCTMCGGNWGGMLLSGIQHLMPSVYDAVPDDMGIHAWACICALVELCGIDCAE